VGFRSRDGGVTCSPPAPTALESPLSPASVKRLPNSGALLAIYNDHSGRFPFPEDKIRRGTSAAARTPLVAAISHDGGVTWPWRRVIEGDPKMSFCYTAIHFVGDSMLLAYMTYNPSERATDASGKPMDPLTGTRIRRLSLAWLPTGP
jgi:sialidase-1